MRIIQIPQNGHITISVFNSLGQRVATLIDKDMNIGTYTSIVGLVCRSRMFLWTSLLFFCIPSQSFSQQLAFSTVSITGELRQWHDVILTVDGPSTSETANPNPFLYYRMDVTLRHGDKEIVVPGYFAADGDAANTSATSGNKWRAHLCPDEVGEWTYTISFRQGDNVSISDNPLAGQPVAPPDSLTGSFTIAPTDKSGYDNRYQGTLKYVGNHYAQYAGTGKYFIQMGTQSPENFLGYGEFDNTVDHGGGGGDLTNGVHYYEPHIQDWRAGDPTWKDGKGKGIIGALNYLASKGMNFYYSLTMNVDGDTRETYPFIDYREYLRYDVSKLAQWDIVISHGNTLGMMLMVNVEEEENEQILGKMSDTKRRVYYRELIARFAHNQALQWNLSEEADKHSWNSTQDLKDQCNYIRNLDPYDHPIQWVQYKGEYMSDSQTYGRMLGFPNFDACALQNDTWNSSYYTKKWVDESAAAGHKWLVALIEANLGNDGVKPDVNDYWHDNVRKNCIWPNLMAGGCGSGFYYGENYPNSDNDCEDFRPRDHLFDLENYARQFFVKYLPFWDGMHYADDLVPGLHNYVYAKPGEVYAIYLKNGGSPTLNLSSVSANFTVWWYDPRFGGELQNGSVSGVTGGGQRSLGNPPNEPDKDWAVLVQRVDCDESETVSGVTVLPATTTVGVGATTQLFATVEPICAGNKNVSWSSSDPSVATVSQTGVVTGVEIGTATITATTQEGGFTATCDVTVSDVIIATITIQENETGVESFNGIITTGFSGYTGDGCIDTDNELGNGITWKICVPSSGTYSLQWRYSNGDSKDRPGQLLVDGYVAESYVSLPPTGNWTSWTLSSTVDVTLTAGTHTIRLEGTTSDALGLTDYITITGDSPQAGACASTSVDDRNEIVIPSEFKLYTAYPNPFNPTTVIQYQIPKERHVKVAIYNIFGQRVITLVDEKMKAGTYKVTFNASNLASGVFFYKLETKDFVNVKKMIYLK